ncbi:MAG: efflux RND transporter permease subunit, partial [Candidatus Eremiobacteraeota bacterium]|nr:efflux RND transporter permease subunit [Candidatus Eremiobacteraeota bacterium]
LKRSAAPPRALAWFQVWYERVLRLYHSRLLPFALAHRGTTVFVCFTLVFLSLTLVAPRQARIVVAAGLAVVVMVVWLFARVAASLPWTRRAVTAGEPARGAGRLAFRFACATTNGSQKLGKFLIAAGFALAVGIVFALPPAVDTEFVPASQTGDIQMTFTYPAGTPIAATDRAVKDFVRQILHVPGIVTTISTVGYKPAGWGSTQGGNYGRIYAGMDKHRRGETDRAIADIRKIATNIPGAVITVASEGGDAPIYFTLSGPEDQIDGAAAKLANFIRTIPGTVNVQTGAENQGTRLNVDIDRAKTALLGVNPGDAAAAARIAVGGAVATKVRTQSGLVDVRVQLPARYRNQLDVLRNVKVRSADGSLYRLASLASFSYDKEPSKIERLDKQRVVRVTGGIEAGKTTLGTVISQIQAKLNEPGFLPPGVATRASGDTQFFQETVNSMSIAGITSASLVYGLMVILYGSFWMPFIIMFSVPLAIMGALFALAITHETLNLFSMIGMIMLFGLVAKNGILMVDYANTLRRRGLRYGEAIVQAAETRFRPILMTTASMVFGMLPLALGLAEGAEFRKSMGTILIGGLISSLILTLFLVPVIYTWVLGRIDRNEQRRAARQLEQLPELQPAGVGFQLE